MVLCNCDEFTKAFFEKNELPIGNAIEMPADPYSQHRDTAKAQGVRVSVKLGEDPMRQFLAFDRKVLRFYCYWDDRPSMFGDARKFVLYYYLADDTIEVCELFGQNSGRDPVPNVIKRTRLPRNFQGLPDLAATKENCYNLLDLIIGEYVNVFGRQFLLFNCDEFTRKYYRDTFGIEQRDLGEEIKEPIGLVPNMPVPPYNGFGSDEDSMSNFLNLVPKAPLKDLEKLNKFDKKQLRWAARLDTTSKEDLDRRFLITSYLSDDSLMIYEPIQRNSGFVGGPALPRRDPLTAICARARTHTGSTASKCVGVSGRAAAHACRQVHGATARASARRRRVLQSQRHRARLPHGPATAGKHDYCKYRRLCSSSVQRGPTGADWRMALHRARLGPAHAEVLHVRGCGSAAQARGRPLRTNNHLAACV
jgi:hypothetical protein